MSPGALYCHYWSISEAVVISCWLVYRPLSRELPEGRSVTGLNEHLINERMSSLPSRRHRLEWDNVLKAVRPPLAGIRENFMEEVALRLGFEKQGDSE